MFVDGRSAALGVTPLTLELPAGPAALSVRLDGYLEQRVELNVIAEALERRRLILSRDPVRFARLSVTAQPRGALVRLDGRRVGHAPLELEGLQPGLRALQVEQPAHEPWRMKLQLVAGSTAYVRANLIADDARPWPYWPWLGYGAAGALFASGVAAGVVAVSSNNDGGDADDVARLNHTADALMAGGLVLGAVTLVLQLTGGPSPRSSGTVAAQP